MSKGRPRGSEIRDHVLEIIYHLGKAYGYEIYSVYKHIFKPITLRVIYYHLAQAVKLGQLKMEIIKVEQGNFSWGTTVEKKYYSLTDQAKVQGNEKVREYLANLKDVKKA